MKRAYEIWVLGYDENDTPNGYEKLILCSYVEKETWAHQLFNYVQCMVEKPKETPLAKLVLEEVEYDDEGNSSCVDVLAESEL